MMKGAMILRATGALGLLVSVLAPAMIAEAKTTRLGLLDAVTQNAAIAPRFDPSTPTKLDEFALDPHLRSVHFDFDRVALRPSEAAIVESDARWLKANEPYEVVIEAYADERGTKRYNAALAKRRAMAVKEELVALGVRPDHIAIVSYGAGRPECHAKTRTEACWSKNRRADILVRRMPAQSP